MITNLFITFLNMGISASAGALLLILWRFLTRRRIPYRFYYVLWLVAFFRLIIPVSFASRFSVLNLFKESANLSVGGRYFVTMEYLDSGTADRVTTYGRHHLLDMIAVVWLAVAIGLMVWWIFLYLRTRHLLRYAVHSRTEIVEKVKQALGIQREVRVFVSERIESPILFGFWDARIILPKRLEITDEEKECVLAHEMIHLERFDQCVKAGIFFIAALHWYNPLIWICVGLFNRDIENSCDQEVLRLYGFAYKKRYAMALVNCAQADQFWAGPLAFASSRVGDRVNKVLEYRPLALWQAAAFSALTLMIGLSVTTNPVLTDRYVYIPPTAYEDADTRSEIRQFADRYAEAFCAGKVDTLLAGSTADTAYFLPLYRIFEEDKLQVERQRIFYTGSGTAAVYLTLKQPHPLFSGESALVLEIRSAQLMGGCYAEGLYGYEDYQAIHAADRQNEAAMLCERMIRYGLVSGEYTAENSEKIVCFCMDIAAQRAGLAPGEQVGADAVESVAAEFFAIDDFGLMRKTPCYSAQNETYRFEEYRGTNYEYQILALETTEEGARVTVRFYKDPLQTQTEKTVQYTFRSVK